MTWLLLALLLCPCPVKRDKQGRIVRSWRAIAEFKQLSGYPEGRKGYVIDHTIPLCACGVDLPRNMQWQRADSAKMKDRLEIEACVRLGRKR
jgi:hypothetical protein